MTAVSLTLRPRVYRHHLNRPDFLPSLLGRAYQALTGRNCVWELVEDETDLLIDDTDYLMAWPGQALMGAEDWQLNGAVITALVALMLTTEDEIW